MLRKLRANTEIRFSSQPNNVLMMEFNYGGEDYLMFLAPMVDMDDEGNKKVVEDSVDDLLIRKPKMEYDPDFDPEKADRNKDGELSDWEIAVGNAVAKGIREHKDKKGAEDSDWIDFEDSSYVEGEKNWVYNVKSTDENDLDSDKKYNCSLKYKLYIDGDNKNSFPSSVIKSILDSSIESIIEAEYMDYGEENMYRYKETIVNEMGGFTLELDFLAYEITTFREGNAPLNCRDCEGTGGLYDSYLGIDDECASCEGTGVMEAETFEAEWVVDAVQQNLNDESFVNNAYAVLIGGDAKTFEEKSMAIAETMNQNANNENFTSFVESELFSAETFEAQTVFTPQQVEDNKEWNERSKRGEFWEDLWWKKEGDRYSNHDDPNLYWNPNSPLANELTEQKERFFKNSILPSKERPKPLETQEDKRAYRNLPPKEKNQIETLGMYWRNVDYLKEGYGISEELAEILESSKMFGMYMNQMINPQMIKKYRTKILKALDSYNPKNPKETHITTTLSSHMKTRPIKGPRPAYDGNSSKPGLGYYYSDYYDLPVPFMGYDYEDLSRFEAESFEAEIKPTSYMVIASMMGMRIPYVEQEIDGQVEGMVQQGFIK